MNSDDILDFLEEMGRLKILPRTGWILHGIRDGESIADHCHRVTLLAMLIGDVIAEEGIAIDMERILRIAVLHEISEARIGDIPFPAFRYLSEESKEQAERDAVDDLTESMGEIGRRYAQLWSEFEDRGSFEARIVRAADKLELMIQVYEYEKVGHRNLDRFWRNPWNRRDFDVHPIFDRIMTRLEERRAEIFAQSKGG